MRAGVFTLLSLLLAGPSAAQQPWRARVDSVFAQLDHTTSPGCALGVVQSGELVYARGYGMANLELGVANSPRTAFYIASTSKQFTAAAISLLASEGKLDLDQSIRRWFPELPSWADSVTTRQLVHHASGVRDYLSLWSLTGRGFYDAIPLDDALALIARQRATNFVPGTRHLYSNSGYLLLSVLVQRVSGQSLSQFTTERFFQPAGMSHTRFRDNRALPISNRADGHSWGAGGWQVFRTSFDLVGDGGLVTTVEDLARWEKWFWEDSARADLRKRVQQRGKLTGATDSIAYAFGLVHGNYRGQPVISHGGAFLGFLAELIRFPEQRTSIIVLCNTFTGNPSGRARQVADAVLGSVLQPLVAAQSTPQQPPAAYRADPAALRGLAGRYSSPELDAVYTITADSGQLLVSVRQLRERLIPAAPDTFRMLGSRIAFVRDGRHRVTGMVLSEGRANGIRFERLR